MVGLTSWPYACPLVCSPNSLASTKDPISASDNEALTPSIPSCKSSHEEYSPNHPLPCHSNTMGNLPADIDVHAAITHYMVTYMANNLSGVS